MAKYAPGYTGPMLPAAPPRPGANPRATTPNPTSPVIDNKPRPTLATPKGLGQAMSNIGIKKSTGPMIGQRFGGLGMKKGGKVSSASKRADGCAVKGKTKGKMI